MTNFTRWSIFRASREVHTCLILLSKGLQRLVRKCHDVAKQPIKLTLKFDSKTLDKVEFAEAEHYTIQRNYSCLLVAFFIKLVVKMNDEIEEVQDMIHQMNEEPEKSQSIQEMVDQGNQSSMNDQ